MTILALRDTIKIFLSECYPKVSGLDKGHWHFWKKNAIFFSIAATFSVLIWMPADIRSRKQLDTRRNVPVAAKCHWRLALKWVRVLRRSKTKGAASNDFEKSF